jgi:UDP-galactopyranose mutase
MGTEQILVVGSGFAGATVARKLAENNYKVTVIDYRDHIGGNAYDYTNEYGIRIHKYGAHIFHTSNDEVFSFISRFTEWVGYKHKVVAMLDNGTTVVFPPTKTIVEKFGMEKIKEIFYKPYTKKMWAIEIDDSVIDRVPVRKDNSDLYFPNDKHQYMPKHGYTELFKNMLNHENITVKLSTKFEKTMEDKYLHVFNSMPIDVYYDFCYGELPYRSIKFNTINLPFPKVSKNTATNFTHSGPETRVIEWKNFPNHGENSCTTTITYETPCDYKDNNNERYYPVKDKTGKNREIYNQYKNIKNDKVTFIGRCGLYVYIDMDQAVATSLALVKKFLDNSTKKS